MYHPADALAPDPHPFQGLDRPLDAIAPQAMPPQAIEFSGLNTLALEGRAPSRPAHEFDEGALLMSMLDEVDHGMLVLRGHRVIHANRTARRELDISRDESHPLQMQGNVLAARNREDAQQLEEAMLAARLRRVRKLLVLTHSGERLSLTIIPLPAPMQEDPVVLLVLGKRRVGDDLAVFWYARSQGLTQAESTVLQSLCKGMSPLEIAKFHAVAISTVRTQLASIRAKTGTSNLRDLVNEVACLPPLVHALAGMSGATH